MNTVQYSSEAVCYMHQVLPWAHPHPRHQWHLDCFNRFSRLTRWQTERPLYSVGNNRRSTQWRNQIPLLSTATTSIHWSSRLKYTMPAFPS